MHFFQCRLIPGAECRRQSEWLCSMLATHIECSLNGAPAPTRVEKGKGPEFTDPEEI